MRRTLLSFAILFFLFALASPLRFAYAAAPQTDPLAAARDAIESVVQSLTPPPLPSAPPPTEMTTRSAPKDVSGAQVASAIASAARNATNATIGAVQSASRTLSHSLSQAASAWSAWVYLANADLTTKVKVASIPSTAAAIVSQTGANAPPVTSTNSSALPTPHLFPLAGASSKQSNRTYATANVGVALGTSTQVSYVTQDELTAAVAQLQSSINFQLYNSTSTYAYGGIWNAIAASQRINNLSGTSNSPLTISNVTVNGVSGLTAADIPSLSGTYLALTGGALTGLFTTTGNVGIGTSSPTHKLSVWGAGTNGFFGISSTTSGDIFNVLSNGNVGIGTSTPASTLSIQGALSVASPSSSVASLGAERTTDGGFTTDPSGSWTLGPGWSWDSVNGRASYTAGTGPISAGNTLSGNNQPSVLPAVTVDTGGTGYTNGDVITIASGSADATYSVTLSSGAVSALTQVSAGTAYTSGTGLSTTGGTGTGLKVSINQIADASPLTQTITTNSSDPTTTYPSRINGSVISGVTYKVTFTIQPGFPRWLSI